VTKLPLSALKEQQGHTIVWLVDGTAMTVRAQPVQLAGADGNQAVIASGLKQGDVVVTAGVHVLTPGQKVKYYVEPAASATTAIAADATAVSVK
jgi:membrane fusion protein, multidrug efflux system